MKIWIDIKNAHEPLFFKTFLTNMPEHDYYISCRDFAEIVNLLKKYNIDHQIIGYRPEGNMIKRTLGFFYRVLKLFFNVPKFDVSLNHASIWAIYTSKLRFKKNITFTDNDINHLLSKRMFKHVDYLLIPNAITKKIMIKDNMKEEGIYQYNGFKEDIYIADFIPNPNFLQNLSFKDFVTIRPESIQATYYPKGFSSIVPQLFKELSKENINVLFLPRYKSDKDYAKGCDNVYIPPEPLNGLDVGYHSKAVLTGAGTFAREAACIGTPAVSFFPGKQLLSVDQKMIENGWILHSRAVEEIVDYVLSMKKRKPDLNRSKRVQKEVLNIVNEILDGIEKKNR